jgi:hypothetical protein
MLSKKARTGGGQHQAKPVVLEPRPPKGGKAASEREHAIKGDEVNCTSLVPWRVQFLDDATQSAKEQCCVVHGPVPVEGYSQAEGGEVCGGGDTDARVGRDATVLVRVTSGRLGGRDGE